MCGTASFIHPPCLHACYTRRGPRACCGQVGQQRRTHNRVSAGRRGPRLTWRRARAARRYDDERQGAINLFLGHFQPRPGEPALWDLDTDHYLHSGAPAVCA